jgi:hypothetical protein
MSEIVEKCTVVRHAAAGASKNSLAVGTSAVILVAAWLLVPLHAPSAQAAVIVSEGFESTTFDRSPEAAVGEGYCDNNLSECSNAVVGCIGCASSPNKATIQSSVAHSGSKAFKGEFLGSYTGAPEGNCGAAGFKILNDGASSYNQSIPANVWIRLYVKFDPSLRFNNSGNKIMDTGFGFYFTGRPYGSDHLLDLGVYSSQQAQLGQRNICGSTVDDLATMRMQRECDAGDGDAWVVDTTNPNHTNGWWYFELNFNTSADVFSMWAKRPTDSSVTQIYNNHPWAFDPWNGQELYFGWWNFCSGSQGGGGTIYYDDVALGNAYIGPVGGDTTPPAAPIGLGVQ